jgi:hypothetical protein
VHAKRTQVRLTACVLAGTALLAACRESANQPTYSDAALDDAASSDATLHVVEGGEDAVVDGGGEDAVVDGGGEDAVVDGGGDARIGCSAPDDPPTVGVPCGGQICNGSASACCHVDPGYDAGIGGCVAYSAYGYCRGPQGCVPVDGSSPACPGPVGMTYVDYGLSAQGCDGPEDCAAGQACLLGPSNSGCSSPPHEPAAMACHSSSQCVPEAPFCGPLSSLWAFGDGLEPPYLVRTCTKVCSTDVDCLRGTPLPWLLIGPHCYADDGCEPTCHWQPLAADGGVDAGDSGTDAGLPDGCVTPYTPGVFVCGSSGECGSPWQGCCGSTCNSGHSCLAPTACDGPEDCPAGSNCHGLSCGPGCFGNSDCPSIESNCLCHSDRDCPTSFPYCNPFPCGGTNPGWGLSRIATCQTAPPLGEAGLVYGSCTLPAGSAPPNYGITCGAVTCALQSDECCWDPSPHCGPRQPRFGDAACRGMRFQCDGPEDCNAGDRCCAAVDTLEDDAGHLFGPNVFFCSGGCSSISGAMGPLGVVCHTSADCPSGVCVPSDAGPFMLCE